MQQPGALLAANVTKHHGPQLVLADVTLVVPPRARIGLVGPNGVGKSTLLRVLAGLEPPDAGSVRLPPGMAVGYLPQEPEARPGETLLESLARRTGVADAAARMDSLAARLDAEPELAAEYADALDRFLLLGGGDLEARAGQVTADVGLPPDGLHRPLGNLSGGEAARASLAAILLARFDVLLLDEPTNDLDFAGLELLDAFVSSTPAALVVVSHDRAFLDRAVERIVELQEDTHTAREYAGGWTEYAAERERALARHYEAFGRYVDERDRIREQELRMRVWEERGYGQGRKKKKSKDVKKAYAKRAERLERVEKPYEPWQLRLSLAARERSGDVVLRLEDAVVERGSFRLGPLDLELRWGDRLALVGPNGSGKTTLLDAIVGRLPLAEGTRRVGPTVVVGELEQQRAAFRGPEPLAPAFAREAGLPVGEARTLLAKFDLGADHVLRPTGSLSPGERTRASLALLSARGVNCLVLDEPTNHLDVEAIEQLETALTGYEGTVILVTHDRLFLERFGATRTLELEPQAVR
jgi:ATPase subunit of ABC transporter with duplicated ATPase domains